MRGGHLQTLTPSRACRTGASRSPPSTCDGSVPTGQAAPPCGCEAGRGSVSADALAETAVSARAAPLCCRKAHRWVGPSGFIASSLSMGFGWWRRVEHSGRRARERRNCGREAAARSSLDPARSGHVEIERRGFGGQGGGGVVVREQAPAVGLIARGVGPAVVAGNYDAVRSAYRSAASLRCTFVPGFDRRITGVSRARRGEMASSWQCPMRTALS